jgi:alpha(1,3/1,4) fucosyltransferase
MRKKILLQTPYPAFDNNKIFETKDGNNALARWRALKTRLEGLGYEFTTADNNSLENCEGIIFHDGASLYLKPSFVEKTKNFLKKLLGIKTSPIYPTRDLYEEAVKAGLKDKLVFFIWEAKVTGPLNFSPEILNRFNRVMTWNDDQLKDPKFIQYCMPMEEREILPKAIPWKEKKLLMNMSMNKFSREKGEMYSARERAVAYFDKHYPNDFDLYGYRWGKPITRLQFMFPSLIKHYSTYRGSNEDKIGTLSKYKFNICYENVVDVNGWITEKIFNSFQARMVPIYWGAPNITEYVDADTFIDRRKFKDEAELAQFITNMTEEEYNKYLLAQERYVKSDKYRQFTNDVFCDRIIYALNLKPIQNA